MLVWLCLCALVAPGVWAEEEPLDVVNFSEREIKEMTNNVNKLFLMANNATDDAHMANGDVPENHKMLMMMMMLNQAKGWGKTSTSTRNCQGYADLVLLLDSSGSITDEHFKTQKNFAGRLANNFRLRTNNERSGYQISVVSFSNNVKEEFPLNKFTNRIHMLQEIQKIDYMRGGTQTHKGLKYVLQNSFEQDNGGRRDAVKIVIVVTDGKSANPSDTAKWARELKQSGVLVLAVGVGDGVDRQELVDIASGRQNIFSVDSVEALETIREALGSRTCAVTINNGGIVPDSADFDAAAYHRFVEEKREFEAQKEQELEILEKLEAFQKRKTVEEEYEEKEMHEKKEMSTEEMQTTVTRMTDELTHFDVMAEMKLEMHHSYMFMVGCKMFQFCNLTAAQAGNMRRVIQHGGEACEQMEADECDKEDSKEALPLAGVRDPVQVAQALDGLNTTQVTYMFFNSMRNTVCSKLTDYLDQVAGWVVQYPEFAALI